MSFYVSLGSFLLVSSTQMNEIVAGSVLYVRFLFVARGEHLSYLTDLFKDGCGDIDDQMGMVKQIRATTTKSTTADLYEFLTFPTVEGSGAMEPLTTISSVVVVEAAHGLDRRKRKYGENRERKMRRVRRKEIDCRLEKDQCS
ncbi:hypothetical protein EZV62_003037 [Acer yangbiense]|uniref:Uncharacterized protein n=1 Tax=Acer yangbiense TaxID=1000413 RepID=A0A5C7IZA6_9ROSI|nr:hypothetical protein EZV62_003037 [Acer yangbiense]